jgi:hypothetical protein
MVGIPSHRNSYPVRLSNSTIEAIYRCRASNQSIRAISRQLRLAPATVMAHLRGKYRYSDTLTDKLRRFEIQTPHRPETIPDGYVTLRQISLLTPLSCGEWKLRQMVRTGKLNPSVYGCGYIYSLKDVEQFLAVEYGHLPDGVAVVSTCLDMVMLDDYQPKWAKSIPSVTIAGRNCHMLWDIERRCQDAGLRFEVPPIVHSRVARRLTYGAKCVLIHEGLWI